ncbi:VWA domain-containing protein [Bacillus mangrovi]|uniref:VWA domain-containing protein n=1 Tax=Metabacillus mangrovi TaxID=1491830 RepID=A0A7X2S6S6_9BACI|nr:VWA domain-containing protein [Metabacillus mangrovi]MTH54266.1 VWA domain-containing protein [Metabacillus mangrovi]
MNQKLKEVVFLLDRSGSMAGLEQDTIGGFNAMMKNQTERGGDLKATVVLFDDQYELLWNGADAAEVRLTEEDYYVRGATAMLDAIGKTITDVGLRLNDTPENERPGKVTFVITTDGMENASRNFTYAKVKELISHQREAYSWEFLFLGANIDVMQEADSLGIQAECAHEFSATSEGIQVLYSSIEQSLD